MQLPLFQGDRKAVAQAADLEAGSENLHIRKRIVISHLPSLPQIFWMFLEILT